MELPIVAMDKTEVLGDTKQVVFVLVLQAWFAGQNLAIEFHEFNIGGYKSKNACVTTLKKENVEIHTHRSTSCYAAEVGVTVVQQLFWLSYDMQL